MAEHGKGERAARDGNGVPGLVAECVSGEKQQGAGWRQLSLGHVQLEGLPRLPRVFLPCIPPTSKYERAAAEMTTRVLPSFQRVLSGPREQGALRNAAGPHRPAVA